MSRWWASTSRDQRENQPICAPWETTRLRRIGGRSLKQVPVSVQPANMDVLRTAVQSIDATYEIKLLGLERVVVPIVPSRWSKALP